jgi:hypothetical protein
MASIIRSPVSRLSSKAKRCRNIRFDPTASAVMPEVPLIVGTNRTEMTLQLAGDDAAFKLDEAGLKAREGLARRQSRERAAGIAGSAERDTVPVVLSWSATTVTARRS